MSDDVKPEVIKKTQASLGKYFKKPPLTEKLLKKPPFRFLHDIVSAIIRETGFLDGLFSDEELNSDNVKDKEAKLAYLAKLIDVVKLITERNLSVRPSKIIAGQEATKTNELLQAIGEALDNNLSSSEAIEHYKKGSVKESKDANKKRSSSQSKKIPEKEAEQKKRSSSTGKALSKSAKADDKEKHRGNGEGYNQQNGDKLSSKVVDIPPAEPVKEKLPPSAQKRKTVSSTKSTTSAKVTSVSGDLSKQTKSDENIKRKESTNKKKEYSHNRESETKEVKQSGLESLTNTESLTSISNTVESEKADGVIDSKENTDVDKLPSKESHRTEIGNLDHSAANHSKGDAQATEESKKEETPSQSRTSLRPPSARPASARPAAPRMRAKPDLVVNEEITTPMGNISVIVENADAKNDDDAEDMVVMETRNGTDSLDNIGGYKIDSQLTQEHGHLVAQILETQRELVNTDNVDVLPKKVDISWEPGAKRDRETMIKEVDKLRSTIQTLTRATNPLGKLLDYVQEDVEIMQKELLDWQNQYYQLNEQLEKEKMQTRELIEPMNESLKDIDYNIKSQLDKICQVKARIIKNDQKIQKLLNGHS